jgi:plastocyanin
MPGLPARLFRPRTLAFLALVGVASLGACGGGGGGGPTGTGTNPITPVDNGPVATTAVTLRNSSFTPPAIVVAPGATVTFSNQDGIAHNVTFSNAAIRNVGDFSGGTADVAMPTSPGTYNYSCTLHAGMNGSVKVE